MKKIIWISLSLFAICFLLVFTLYKNQQSNCPLNDLSIKDNMMPIGWNRLWSVLPPALPTDGAVDAIEIDYEYGNNRAYQTIYQYKNEFFAFFFLRFNNQLLFPTAWIKWTTLKGNENLDLNGNENRIRCGESQYPIIGYRCSAVVRYGQFISHFSTPIAEGIMSTEQFQSIVLAIDDQISTCIKRP
jgi:hypothetical protein